MAKDVTGREVPSASRFAGPIDTLGTLSERRDFLYDQSGGCRSRAFGSALICSGCQCLGAIGIGTRLVSPHVAKTGYTVPRESCCSIARISRSGAGETPLVGLAPALGNAIFDATGAWLNLPLALPVPKRR